MASYAGSRIDQCERHRRHLADSPICELCQTHPKTTLHGLRDCALSTQFWKKLLPPSRWSVFFSMDLGKWLEANLTNKMDIFDASWDVSFGISVWRLWHGRNNFIFNGIELVVDRKINENIKGRHNKNCHWKKRYDNDEDEEERSAHLGGAQKKKNLSDQPRESRRFEGKCYNYGKKGHIARNCWSKKKPAEENAVTSDEAHKSEDGWNLEALSVVIEEEEIGKEIDLALTATVAELVNSNDEWIDNSGSSSDETKDMKELSNLVEYSKERTVTVDNLVLPISNSGEKESAKEDR
ncbi:Unknown protein [Striga hermonthica]|uniref:CCHC-type domain-containing protein n=1 Tax=Striga hermonthica TaxID=68872 RepID=A0A9N7MQF9_STRHE|nr:Unknown protein [Striga hermonthica]